jgi:hypothetical protein
MSLLPHLADSMDRQQRLAMACINRWQSKPPESLAGGRSFAWSRSDIGLWWAGSVNFTTAWLVLLDMQLVSQLMVFFDTW